MSAGFDALKTDRRTARRPALFPGPASSSAPPLPSTVLRPETGPWLQVHMNDKFSRRKHRAMPAAACVRAVLFSDDGALQLRAAFYIHLHSAHAWLFVFLLLFGLQWRQTIDVHSKTLSINTTMWLYRNAAVSVYVLHATIFVKILFLGLWLFLQIC